MLAQAVLEALADRGAQTLVTTHYEPLKALAAQDERFANAAVGFDLERLAPTFRLHLGMPGASAALDVARRLSFPEPALERARELLGGQREVDALLRIAADERERLADERSALEEERKATAEAYERASRAELDAKQARTSRLDKEYAAAMDALKEARLELDRARSALKERKRVDVKAAQKRIDQSASRIRKHEPRTTAPVGTPLDPADACVGREVQVPALGARGVIVRVLERGKVEVQMGIMKSVVAVAELQAVTDRQGSRAKKEPKRAPAATFQTVKSREAPVRTPDSTLDLRGERVHDAERLLDRFIDTALLAHREVIFVVHGHGTGAVRSAVRSWLQGHASVTEHRPGEPSEGGDGITLAWLDC
jgi:DNA mismatch repair protein MutS2